MNVIDGLTAVISGIDHRAISLGEALGPCDFRRSPVQVAEQFFVGLLSVSDRGDMFPWNDQNVDRRLGIEIGKSVALVVLVDGL